MVMLADGRPANQDPQSGHNKRPDGSLRPESVVRAPIRARFVPPGTWTAERVLDAMREWATETGQPPYAYQWSPALARAIGRDAEKWEREYPRWPSTQTVDSHHGTWGNALLEAGLPGGRPEFELPLNERVDTAKRMRAAGLSYAEIADDLGGTPYSARAYTLATRCGCARNWKIKGGRCRQCALEETRRRQDSGWSDEQRRLASDWLVDVRNALTAATVELGHAPSRDEYDTMVAGRDWPGMGTILARFGTWSAALDSAGLSPKGHVERWTREAILTALRAFAGELGRQPTHYDVHHNRIEHYPSATTVIAKFGSWSAVCRELGWDVQERRSDDEHLAALRSASSHFGRGFSVEEYRVLAHEHGWPQSSAINRRFGSWHAAIQAARVTPLIKETWTAAQVLDRLSALERALGRQPSSRDLNPTPPDCPSLPVISDLFGSWGALCRELNWHTRPSHSDEDTRAALRAAALELGPTFSHTDYRRISRDRGWPSETTITKRHGSWSQARDAAIS